MSYNGNRFAPLRKKDDFLATLDKYELPNFNNPEKVNKRITKNLLYYQTNYFLVFIVFFILVG
jgi:PRA1 family protein 3